MARDEMNERHPMPSERLAEIKAHRDEAQYAAENGDDMEYDDPVILWQQFADDLTDSVAEVERLRAREAALLAVLRLNWMFLDCQECAAWRDVEQALPDVVAALRAAEQQKASGGDGA